VGGTIEPGVVAREPRQHREQSIDVDIVFGRFVGLAVPEELSAGRDIIVACRGLDEGRSCPKDVQSDAEGRVARTPPPAKADSARLAW